jgi:hypothetical protein
LLQGCSKGDKSFFPGSHLASHFLKQPPGIRRQLHKAQIAASKHADQ